MMIKEQVKALWKICFDDSEEFVEMYFRLRYKTEVNVAIHEVISALQMLPYPMTFGGETVQTSYISGASRIPISEAKGSCESFYHSLSPGCCGMEYISVH